MRSRLSRLAWLALVLAAACHRAAIPTARSHRPDPAWIELTSEHFTLWTDAAPARGRELIREMEQHLRVVAAVAFDGHAVSGRSLAIALDDRAQAASFVPEQFAAFTSPLNILRQPVITLPATARNHTRMIAHELSHVVAYSVIREQPKWFAEGLATFVETVQLDAGRRTGRVGDPPDYIAARLLRLPPRSAAAVMACADIECADDMFYATAWAMFAYLANEHPHELAGYGRRLGELAPGADRQAHEQAWADAFPELTADRLDRELRAWLARGRPRRWQFTVELAASRVTERALGDGDVHAIRALLRHLVDTDDPRVPLELAAALASDPTNVLANFLRASRELITSHTARAVAAAHPDDWRAWLLVAFAERTGPDSADAMARACRLARQNPAVMLPATLCDAAPAVPRRR